LTAVLEAELATSLECPLCGSTSFGDYRRRKKVRCAGCGSFERGRLLGLVFKRLAPAPTGAPVVHFAPEMSTSKLLREIYGSAYTPADYSPEAYPWMDLPMRKIDLTSPDQYLPPRSVQGLVHCHILEHVPGDLTSSLIKMNDAIQPGGFHIFVVPYFSRWFREDLDTNMSHEERDRLFGQFDHVRSFGTEDFYDRMALAFRDFERVDLRDVISRQDLLKASVPEAAVSSLTSHSVHFFRKHS
jgi:phosphoglycolate phosphatase